MTRRRPRILADENIPGLGALAEVAEVRRIPGRAIDAASLADAEALLVRSVTRVDAALVEGSQLRFVGSATIGIDHVDRAALEASGIAFAHAPGSSARAVAEYVVSALLALAHHCPRARPGGRVGVVGVGHVGRRLTQTLQALGYRCVAIDPFVADPPAPARTLDAVLGELDVLTLHVPLVGDGPHPTHHLLDAARLAQLDSGAVLINTSRGAVVCNHALRSRLEAGPSLTAVLDVFECEPGIDRRLARLCALATPHIAGYSLDAKLRGSARVQAALRRHFGLPGNAVRLPVGAPPAVPRFALEASAEPWRGWARATAIACPLAADHMALLHALGGDDPAGGFDRLRRDYPVRREFPAHQVELTGGSNPTLAAGLCALGFALG